jgi:hypothetical protein
MPPFHDRQELAYAAVLMGVEDGMLMFAAVQEHTLHLWSMEASPNRAKEWARHRVIELEPVLPPPALSRVREVGFAEGVGVIFRPEQHGTRRDIHR